MTSDRDYAEADALWEFVTNPDQPPRDEVERTVRRVQGVVGAERTAETMPRDRIWAEIVTSTGRPPVRPSRAATGFVPASSWTRSRIGRWPSMVSYGLMVAVIFSLFGTAHDRVMSPALATPAPELMASDFLVFESTPTAEGGCVAREVGWEGDPDSQDTAPAYQAKQPAPVEIGELALETYIAFSNCPMTSFDPNDLGSSPEMTAVRSFVTDRQWTTWFSSPPDHSDTTDELITQEAVIPVNRPIVTYTRPNESGLWEEPTIDVFWPSDAHELVDGRNGVVIGSLTTEAFRSTGVETGDYRHKPLFWLAFVEQNGHLFIDEFGSFCTGDWVYMDGQGNPVSTPLPDIPQNGTTVFCRP